MTATGLTATGSTSARCDAVTADLLSRTYEQRVAEPCIGRDRADLVLAGCAILDAMLRMWPCSGCASPTGACAKAS